MTITRDFAAGGYRFIPGPFQYSGGVSALRGYEIRRVRFRRPLPLARGFELAAEVMQNAGRPLTAFCARRRRLPSRVFARSTNFMWEHCRNGKFSTAQTIRWRAATYVHKSNPRRYRRCMRSHTRSRLRVMVRRPSSSPVAPKHPRGQAATRSAACGTAMSVRKDCVRKRASSSVRWNVASALLPRVGGIPPRPKSTQYMISIHFLPMKSFGAEPLRRG